MSYQTALTIAEVVTDIHRKKYLLPAIQREFVWDTEQIERLFDSLMRDYPISSFLFWEVSKENVHEYEFYEFLRQYHERKQKHNPKASITGEEGISAVLDGQQRLTSLYIALKGTYAYKLPRKRWDNEQAYPERKLYLNILAPADHTDRAFDFRFLTKEESDIKDDTTFWFSVPEILNLKELEQINEFLISNEIFQNYTKEAASFANKAMSKLYKIIHVQQSISYYLEKSQELDKVLNIFIRINSGGTTLSYSDLLLSIATAQWEEKDAREEITQFVDEINNTGSGFNFNKDFVLKSALILSDLQDITFKVDNFNKTNMLLIESKWEEISNALRIAVNLVASFAYSRDTLTSNNAIIPIAYYILKNNLQDGYLSSSHTASDRKLIHKWLIRALVKRQFGGQGDSIQTQMRKVLSEDTSSSWPFEKIVNTFKGKVKSISFSEEDIDNLLSFKYGQSYTFSVLALLYPSLDFNNVFHLDHIHPRSYFTNSKLKKAGIDAELWGDYKDRVDRLANLQMLEARPNIEKSDRPFNQWIEETYSDKANKDAYLKKHHMDTTVPRSFEEFVKFFDARQNKIKEVLKTILM